MAILLTGIGLFSLSSLLAQQRTRSMAIRKVLGGSVPSLIRLMSHEFTWLVVVGNLIAWPIAYYAVNWWLDDFAYRVEVSELIFLATGMATVLGAWMTVGYQTLRAVLANPVDSLRHE
jgi:putative ABC transport system permease protein